MESRGRLADNSQEPRFRRYYFACCIGLLLAYVAYWFTDTTPGFPLGGPGDFATFITGALVLRSGQGHHLYDLVLQSKVQDALLRPSGWLFASGILPYIYPPHFAALLIPLTYLPLSLAFHVWNLVSFGFLLATIRLLLSCQKRTSNREFLATSIVVLAFFPVFQTFYLGQSTLIVLFGLTLTYVLLKRGFDGWAGLALAGCMIKPQLVIVLLIVMLVKRRWRVIFALAATGSALIALSGVLVGIQGIKEYASLSRSLVTWNGQYGLFPTRMANLRGTAYRLSQLFGVPATSQSVSWFVILVTATLSVLVLCFILYCYRGGWAPNHPTFDLKFALTIVGTLLLTPYLYGHDLSLLVLAGFIVFEALTRLNGEIQARRLITTGHAVFPFSFLFGRLEGWTQVITLFLLALLLYLGLTIRKYRVVS